MPWNIDVRIAAFHCAARLASRAIACVALCVFFVGNPTFAADTPYYGGFGPGFLHLNSDGTYGKGEIRSGDLGLKFYGPQFGGPYNFKMYVRHDKGVWTGDLIAKPTSGVRVKYQPLFPKCQYEFQHRDIPLQVKMEAFAPWIPGDSKMSSLPVLFFDFEVTNPDATEKNGRIGLCDTQSRV